MIDSRTKMEAVAAMAGGAGIVPKGKTRVIFKNAESETGLGFDMDCSYYREICPNGSCQGKTLKDFEFSRLWLSPASFY